MSKEITITASDENYEILQKFASKNNQSIDEFIHSMLFPFQEQQK